MKCVLCELTIEPDQFYRSFSDGQVHNDCYRMERMPEALVLRKAAQIQSARRQTRKGWPKGKKRT